MKDSILAVFGLPGGTEWIVILVIGLLLFGRRLPDVARSVGRSIVEFKKGIKDVRDDVEKQADASDRANGPSDSTPRLDRKPGESATSSAERETSDSGSAR